MVDRDRLVEAGQDFEFADPCNACHFNCEGSPWKGVKKPYTSFASKVNKKYAFDFEKAVRSDKALHEHFKRRRLHGSTHPQVPRGVPEKSDKVEED